MICHDWHGLSCTRRRLRRSPPARHRRSPRQPCTRPQRARAGGGRLAARLEPGHLHAPRGHRSRRSAGKGGRRHGGPDPSGRVPVPCSTRRPSVWGWPSSATPCRASSPGSARRSVSPGRLYVPDPHPETFERGPRRVVLVGIVSGYSASVFSFDRFDVVWFGYPVPGLNTLWATRETTVERDRLKLVVGALGAKILREPAHHGLPGRRIRLHAGDRDLPLRPSQGGRAHHSGATGAARGGAAHGLGPGTGHVAVGVSFRPPP